MIRFRAGKAPGRGLDARLVLRHDQPALDDPAGELAVRCRVVAVDAAAEHGDRDAADVESAAVRLAVDPPCHAADDDEPRSRQLAPERSARRSGRTTSMPAHRRSRPQAAQAARSAPSPRSQSASVGRGSRAAAEGTPSAPRLMPRTLMPRHSHGRPIGERLGEVLRQHRVGSRRARRPSARPGPRGRGRGRRAAPARRRDRAAPMPPRCAAARRRRAAARGRR